MGCIISTLRHLVDEHGRNKLVEEENSADQLLNNYHIPMDLTAEILSRLPIKSMARFTSVSKSWRDLITSTSFSTNRLARNNPYYTFFGTTSSSSSKSSKVIQFLNKGGARAEIAYSVDKRFIADSIPGKLVVGSCNGLLCLADRTFGFERISILNPITKESIGVTHSNYNRRRSEARYRFGYSPSTNEYKVLRCLGPARSGEELLGFPDRYAIFTVGVDKTWRNLSPGLFPDRVSWHQVSLVPCSCSGALYWLAGNDDDRPCSFVLAFDIARENTRTIPFPRSTNPMCLLQSLVPGDPLCLHFRENNRSDVVWKMEAGEDVGRWSLIALPAFLPYRGNVKAVETLYCAAKCGVVLSCVQEASNCTALMIRLYCPQRTAIPLRHKDRIKLLCEFTPSFCSINEIMGKPPRSRH